MFHQSEEFCLQLFSSCDSYSSTVLLSKENHNRPELIDEDNEFIHLDDMEMLGKQFGDSVRHTRDGSDMKGKIINILLDPSQVQILWNVKCSGNKVMQTHKRSS